MSRRRDADVSTWVKMYVEQGMTVKAIAAQCGRARVTVSTWLREAGVEVDRWRCHRDGDRYEGRTDVTPAHVRALYEQGKTIRDIAAELDCSYGLVHRRLDEAEATLRDRGSPPAAGSLDPHQMAEMYQAGASLQTIAAQIGSSSTTVYRRLLAMGVQMRLRSGEWPDEYRSGQ